ncbi:MAG: sulfatase-like hydrolase/transferase [Gammaproteobacteria bacterium]|nr:sulfatase-like hydrolase/transferase [Gammaproteobacteria bacterium]
MAASEGGDEQRDAEAASISRREALVMGAATLLGSLVGQAGASAGVSEGASAGKLPNILWFVSEDNNPLIGAYGDRLAHTPTIDGLAARGILYRNVYCTAPVCGPSRFSILTGLYPYTAGASENMGPTDTTLPPFVVPYPMSLRAAGYYCTNNAKKNYCSQFEWLPIWDESSRQAHWRNRPKGKPFMAVFNTFTTHESCLFDPLAGRVKPEDVTVPEFLPDTPGVRQDIATFYNAMEKMDGELAGMLAELEADGVADDTIVFHYSDNGGILPRGKRFCYEEGMRCEMVVYLPPKWAHLAQIPPGSVVEAPVSLMDLVPTLLSITGRRPPDYLHGRALLGRHQAPDARYAFGGRNRMDERYDLVRTVTDTRHRYLRNYSPHRPYAQHIAFMFQARSYQDWEAGHRAGRLNAGQERFWRTKPYEELYDLQADRYQLTNLVDHPAHRAKLEELRRALDEHQLQVHDVGFIPEGTRLKGYVESRRSGAYPLRRVMALAARAAQAAPADIPLFVQSLADENEVIRYWGAQGLLILGERARPALPDLHAALDRDQSVPVRIALAESLINLDNSHAALRALGTLLEQESNGAYRTQAINALSFVGERARPVLPAIRRAATEDHRNVRNVAEHLLAVLEGRYDPHQLLAKPGGGTVPNPFTEDWDSALARPYD